MITLPIWLFITLLFIIALGGIVFGLALAPLLAVIAMKDDPFMLPDMDEDDGLPDDVKRAKEYTNS